MGEKFSFSPFTSYPKIVIKENAITSPANYFPFYNRATKCYRDATRIIPKNE